MQRYRFRRADDPMQPDQWVFFLSHASYDRKKDGLLKKFFTDLNTAVAERLQIDQSRAGFMDAVGIEVGQDWSTQLGGALRTSGVLVALMSGAYFESAGCGREVHVFLERRELLVKRAGGNPAAILPLWWQPLRSGGTMPAVLSRFQWNDSTLPAPYTDGGIRGVALGPNRGLYAMLVAQIADKIALSWDVDLDPLPPGGLGDFDGLPNAFAGEDPAEVSPPNGAAPSNVLQMTSEDPYKVNFLYVAPRRREVVQERSPESYSDRGSWFWQPHLPACRDTIGQIVNSFSFRYDGRAHSLDDENVADVLREAGRKDQLVVMILDPWATLNEQCRTALQQFDSSSPLNFAVLTVWSAADRQTSESADILEDGLRLAFPRSYSRSGNERFRRSSGGREEFGLALQSILEQLTQSIIDQRTANSRIAGPRLQVFKLVPGQAA